MVDEQSKRVYEAQAWMHDEYYGADFRTIDDVRKFFEDIFATKWFRQRYRSVSGLVLRDGRGEQYASGVRLPGGICRITLPRDHRCELIALHELAHCVSYGGHGPDFIYEYVELVRRFMGKAAARELRMCLKCSQAQQRRPPDYDHHGLTRTDRMLDERRQRQAFRRSVHHAGGR